jgi:hypothetical protein
MAVTQLRELAGESDTVRVGEALVRHLAHQLDEAGT